MPLPTIDRFEGEYQWLSNFWMVPLVIQGKVYPSVEHYFQACKARTPEDHEAIRRAATPGHAKRMGKRVLLRLDWERVKEDVMLHGLRAKFVPGTDEAKWLLATGDALLIEGNSWKDSYWGVHQGTGKNRLGHLLMQVRQELVMQS